MKLSELIAWYPNFYNDVLKDSKDFDDPSEQEAYILDSMIARHVTAVIDGKIDTLRVDIIVAYPELDVDRIGRIVSEGVSFVRKGGD